MTLDIFVRFLCCTWLQFEERMYKCYFLHFILEIRQILGLKQVFTTNSQWVYNDLFPSLDSQLSMLITELHAFLAKRLISVLGFFSFLKLKWQSLSMLDSWPRTKHSLHSIKNTCIKTSAQMERHQCFLLSETQHPPDLFRINDNYKAKGKLLVI